jgi:hypothetical protein
MSWPGPRWITACTLTLRRGHLTCDGRCRRLRLRPRKVVIASCSRDEDTWIGVQFDRPRGRAPLPRGRASGSRGKAARPLEPAAVPRLPAARTPGRAPFPEIGVDRTDGTAACCKELVAGCFEPAARPDEPAAGSFEPAGLSLGRSTMPKQPADRPVEPVNRPDKPADRPDEQDNLLDRQAHFSRAEGGKRFDAPSSHSFR